MSCANTLEILKQRLDKQWSTAWPLMCPIPMCIWPLNITLQTSNGLNVRSLTQLIEILVVYWYIQQYKTLASYSTLAYYAILHVCFLGDPLLTTTTGTLTTLHMYVFIAAVMWFMSHYYIGRAQSAIKSFLTSVFLNKCPHTLVDFGCI